ncbi:hypothetical protein E2C01_086789 [Portunus trituberculatus]|uniref:Uncharacterized protein n=1 Tax=Portunus trituberculatus TaxID=210409 RepID=A0A5B7JBH2_PORTR|nr:hypothetical protein [Portunus trituberculatus]
MLELSPDPEASSQATSSGIGASVSLGPELNLVESSESQEVCELIRGIKRIIFHLVQLSTS